MPHSYNGLYEDMFRDTNIILAIQMAAKGKSDRRQIIKYLKSHPYEATEAVKEYLRTYIQPNHKPKKIHDGIEHKIRWIYVPSHSETIIHHCIVLQLKRIIMKMLYKHTNGSLPGRGIEQGRKYMKRWVQESCKDWKNIWVVQVDIKKFFDHIDHDILKQQLRRVIRDKRYNDLLWQVIDVIPKGLPLGFYTSQWLANFYLSSFDHLIKDFGAQYYMRYMDDIVVLCETRDEARRVLAKITKELGNLKLILNPKTKLYKLDNLHPIDVMGYKFYRNKVTLRKSMLKKFKKKVKQVYHEYIDTGKIRAFTARQLLSYKGWLSKSNSHKLYCKYMKPYGITFSHLAKIVSKQQKISNDWNYMLELRNRIKTQKYDPKLRREPVYKVMRKLCGRPVKATSNQSK